MGSIHFFITRTLEYPPMYMGTYAAAEMFIWHLLNIRRELLGLEPEEFSNGQWCRLVRERWGSAPPPGALGYCLYVLHSDDNSTESISHHAWARDATEIAHEIMNTMDAEVPDSPPSPVGVSWDV